MNNRLNKLTDIITFGKYKDGNITVKNLIDNHRAYYDYLVKNNIFISRMVEDYVNGNYIIEEKIVSESGKNNTVNVKEVIVFRRKSSSRKIIYREAKILGKYPIPSHIEYEFKTEIRTRAWLGNGLQQDDINCSSEYEVQIRICKNPQELEKFKQDCINLHNTIK